MGISPTIMAGNIIGIVAQRLVRRLCPACKRSYTPTGVEAKLIAGAEKLFESEGCVDCDYQGFSGRFAVMEVLRFDADVDQLMGVSNAVSEIGELLKNRGHRTLYDEALRRIAVGDTSFAEASRVIDFTLKV